MNQASLAEEARRSRELRYIDVTSVQINTKRHFLFEVWRMVTMVKEAQRNGATWISLNEISKHQFLAIKRLAGWDISASINDRLKNGNWAGNAVAWMVDHWKAERTWDSATEIDYRKGKKRSPRKGRWGKKTVRMRCARLLSLTKPGFRIVVQAFHYPTVFNSNVASRQKVVAKSERFAAARIKRGVAVQLNGDGNNTFPDVEGLHGPVREGPDAQLSSGQFIKRKTLPFKKRLRKWRLRKLSDHNGLLCTWRYAL